MRAAMWWESHHIAARIYEQVEGIEEVYVWLCSQIGRPIDDPLIASAQVVLRQGTRLDDIAADVERIVQEELSNIYTFTDRLTRGEFSVW